MVDSRQQLREFFYGGASRGSVNFAESLPYIQALTWYDSQYGRQLLQQLGMLRVHVLTDSQVVAQWGNRATSPDGEIPRKQLMLYAALRELRRVGYHCRFHWAPRMTADANWAADLIAGIARREVQAAADPAYVAGSDVATRAANAVGNISLYDPETGQPILIQ